MEDQAPWPCLECGGDVWLRRGQRPKYCSALCAGRYRSARRAQKLGTFTPRVDACVRCAEPIVGGTRRRRFCSESCKDLEMGRRYRQRKAVSRPDVDCPTCGTSLQGRSASAKFCSANCWDVAHGRRLAAPLPSRICALPECDAEFQPKRTIQRCCSERHGKILCHRERRADGRQAPPKWDDRARDHYHRRRALKKQASTGEPVLLSDIRARDKGRCHLCGKRVLDKPWPHPMSPSLDHVVPLTKGGAHDPSNVKLAHLFCNTAKGNRGGGEQLMLIG